MIKVLVLCGCLFALYLTEPNEDEKTCTLGDTWEDGNRTCECVDIFARGRWWGSVQSPQPPIPRCKHMGCKDQRTGEFYPPETEVEEQGETCTCVEGPWPYLADAQTLYHFTCTGDVEIPVEL